jgi:N-acetylglucosaminyldiphosphoundecaprenol N-acetyl-beta-D-mannosaminyltransferase
MKIDFLGIPVDSLSMLETIELIDKGIRRNKHINHVVINAGKVVSMQTNNQLFESVVSCDMISADGQSIVWAARFLGKQLPERVAGIDLMQHLIRLASNEGYKCFFLGAKEEIVKKVVDIYTEKYSPSIIAGYRNGYFSKEEEPEIAKQIADSGAQLLFVAIISPRKENFIYEYRDILSSVNFIMGVGGSFDVISGFTKRAPVWMQYLGLEWFYRFIQEPKRMWRRYLIGNSKFIWIVLKEKLKSKAKIPKRQQSPGMIPDLRIISSKRMTHLQNVISNTQMEQGNNSNQTRIFKKEIPLSACPNQSEII